MEKDEQKMGNKVREFLLGLAEWNDAQRVFSEYDPVPVRSFLLATVYLREVFWHFRYFHRQRQQGLPGKR
jgi:hypothetical protein